MDLDAILARHPNLVLVDDLHHRNAPGSRYERRWQEVDVLRDMVVAAREENEQLSIRVKALEAQLEKTSVSGSTSSPQAPQGI